MDRQFTNILTDDVGGTSAFYETVFGMTRHFDSDWFIILTHSDKPGHEFGILDRSSDIIPQNFQAAPSGMMLTFVVEDCEACFKAAEQFGAKIVETPRLMPYGQKRALVLDPAGSLVDISAPESG